MIAIVMPVILSIWSLYFKWKFPLKCKRQVELICEGIEKRNDLQFAVCPISGVVIPTMDIRSDEEQDVLYLLEHFTDTFLIRRLLADDKEVVLKNLLYKCYIGVAIGASFLIFLMLSIGFTFYLLNSAVLSLIPILLVISLGLLITILVFLILRVRAARRLVHANILDLLSDDFLERVLLYWSGFLQITKARKFGLKPM